MMFSRKTLFSRLLWAIFPWYLLLALCVTAAQLTVQYFGVTRDIDIKMHKLGEGADPWGGYRAGFAGTTTLRLKDYGIQRDLGPASQEVELTLSIEGVRQ